MKLSASVVFGLLLGLTARLQEEAAVFLTKSQESVYKLW